MDGSSNDLDNLMCQNNVPAEVAMLSRLMILMDKVYIILSFFMKDLLIGATAVSKE